MWKVQRMLTGGNHMAAAWVRCVNYNKVAIKNTDRFKTITVFSTAFSVGRVKMTSKSMNRMTGSSANSEPQRAYKFNAENNNSGGMPSGGWMLLVIPVSALGLGIWQVFRWRWKLGLIEEMRLKSIEDPLPLLDTEYNVDELEYRKVKVYGKFDYKKEVIMGPRSLVNYGDRSGEQGRGVFSGSSNNNGYHVITPFKLDGTNESILVNRGWINSRNASKFKHIEENVEIVGIVRRPENRAPFMSKHRPGQNILHYRDIDTMADQLNSNPVFLDLYSIEGVDFSHARQDSIPVPRQTRVTLRNEHVSYFITWFSLSAITSFMWHRRFIRRLNLL